MTGNLTLALLVGGLFAVGTSLVLQRSLTRVLIGFTLYGHAANLLVLTAAGRAGVAPFTPGGQVPADAADPLPQAMALTGIVISMAVTAFLLALAYRSWQLTGTDEVQDDVEDLLVARDRARAGHDPAAADTPRGGVDSSEDADAGSAGPHREPAGVGS